jgi:hypothetical protein
VVAAANSPAGRFALAGLWDDPLVALSTPTAQLPASSLGDIEYVTASFVPMSEAVRPLVERGVLPRATYVLPDGTPMVPADHAALLEEAGGDQNAIAGVFGERFVAAGGDPDEVDEEYEAWLSGEYGACLHSASPEAIRAKSALMAAIEALLARPRPAEPRWAAALRGAVDALDALERPFADHDRERFGGPTSRDRLIVDTRDRFPHVWGQSEVPKPTP